MEKPLDSIRKPLDSSFRAAAQNCNRCYNDSKENSNMFFAQRCLGDIMGSYDKEDENYQLAFELLDYCRSCDLRDPKIQRNLEPYELRI